jgi:hypothetical protein
VEAEGLIGEPSEQLASEANDSAAESSGQDAPGEPLASGAGAAAVAMKDLSARMLGKAEQEQNSYVATQDKGPAGGAQVGVDGGALVGVNAAARDIRSKAGSSACSGDRIG